MDYKYLDLPQMLATHRSEDICHEMYGMLRLELPQYKQNINNAFTAKDNFEINSASHKLHGACCYCLVPELKKLAANIETAALENKIGKNMIEKLDQLIDAVIMELDAYLEK